MVDKIKEVKEGMNNLGYYKTDLIELEMLDADRAKVIYSGHLTIGIWDFVKHTFVD